MIGTLLAAVWAFMMWISPYSNDLSVSNSAKWIMLGSAFLFLLFIPLATLLALLPLQKAEQNVTPRILEMFRKDRHFLLASVWLIAFPLLTFILVAEFLNKDGIKGDWFLALWIVALGVTIDVAIHFVRRVMNYLNPFAVIKMFAVRAKHSIQNDRELDLFDWIDALSEVAIKGIQRYSTSISNKALEEEQEVARNFLGASKSIGHVDHDAQMKSAGISDKVSYTMFYLYQRLDIVFDKALKNRLEPTCTLIVTILGKISVDAAKYDVSLASAPLRFLGKCAKRAQDDGLEETAMTASCVFLEVARAILTEIDITYYEIKDPFFSIINGMETLAKEAFRRDKTMNISLLEQPFKELRELFQTGKAKDHQDTPVIVQNIDRVIGEFDALLIVMNTIPTIPTIEEEPSKG